MLPVSVWKKGWCGLAIHDLQSLRRYGRRSFLGMTVGIAGAALLAACGGSAPATAVPATTASGPTPAAGGVTPAAGGTTPTTGGASASTATVATRPSASTGATAVRSATASAVANVDGLLPAPNPNVPDAYTKLPAVFKSVAAPPGKGGKVTTFQYSFNAPPTARDQNKYWQELEKRLGTTVEPTFTPYGNYAEKLATTIAGGDVPELFMIDVRPAPQLNRYIQQGAFLDLTPYVTGDALKEYPNLSKFPQRVWTNAAIKGKIYGIPRPRAFAGNPLIYRQDWAAKVGFPQVKNANDLRGAMVGMSKQDPDGNGQPDTFGMSAQGGTALNLAFFQQMWRTPNEWKLTNGTLTAALETEESKAAVGFMRDLWVAGGFHPDAANMTVAQCKTNFTGSKIGAYNDSFLTLPGNRDPANKSGPMATVPTANVIGLVPPGHDGGAGVMFASNGVNAMTGIPSRIKDQNRVKDLLRILDYYAAPFGSDERLFLDYGTEGVHYAMNNGAPVTNDLFNAEKGDFQNLMYGPYVLYSPVPGVAAYVQDLVRQLIDIGVDNPAISAYSETYAARSGEMAQLIDDRVTSIVTGRAPLSSYDQLVSDWRSRAGDKMRTEFQDFLACKS